MTDTELLIQHQNGSESAFADLVRRHLTWVYGVARRRLGDPHLADDVAQAVFVLLHRKSPRFATDPAMMSWLYKTACYASDSAARGERRRQFRESKAAMSRPEAVHNPETPEWQELAPLLDELIGKLSRIDREAILLRYYRDLPLDEVAKQIGTTPDAARKRIERAVEKLRQLAEGKGSTISAASLGVALATFVRIPPPTGLIATATTAATAPAGSVLASSTAGIVKGTAAMMTSAKITIAAVATVACIAIGGAVCATVWIASSPAQDTAAATPSAPAKPAVTGTTTATKVDILISPDGTASITNGTVTMVNGGKLVSTGKAPVFRLVPNADLPKLAPYPAIRWRGMIPEVQVNSAWYQLNAVNDISVIDMLNSPRVANDPPEQKQKHFSEDLVEILTIMGHKPGDSVKLTLNTLDADKKEVTLDNIALTSEKRGALMNWPGPDQTSLFQGFRVSGSIPQVQESGTWYDLRAVDKISIEKIRDGGKAAFGEDWQNHNVIEILTAMGHKSQGESHLLLHTLDTDELVTVTVRAPVPQKN